jgi:pectate lyase
LDPINDAWGAERVFMAGNVMEGFNYDHDNWTAYNQNRGEKRSREALIKLVRVDKPIYPSYVKEESARDAYKRVLASAGAVLPRRDVIDRRIVEEVRTGTVHYMGKKAAEWGPGHKNSPNVPGIIDTQTDVLDAKDSPDKPWPHYKTSNVPVDTDHDGMPDTWETSHKLNPNDPADGNADPVGDGYTNLERYLNELVEMGSKVPVE